MAKTPSEPSRSQVPHDYVAIPGSERRPSKSARLIGPTDPNEVFDVTIVLRRRPGGRDLPDHDYFLSTPPSQRQRMPADELRLNSARLRTISTRSSPLREATA